MEKINKICDMPFCEDTKPNHIHSGQYGTLSITPTMEALEENDTNKRNNK